MYVFGKYLLRLNVYPTIKVVFAVIRGMEWLMLSHHHGVLIIAIGTEMREEGGLDTISGRFYCFGAGVNISLYPGTLAAE